MPEVSVIVPLYNAIEYLKKGHLDYIFRQTMNDWELILVDDGSVDDTYEYANEIASKDQRVIIIKQQNQGAGFARNRGLDEAKGKFVYFMDIDDAIEPDLFEYCSKEMNCHQLDMMIFGFEVLTEYNNQKEDVSFVYQIFQSNTQIKEAFVEDILLVRHGNGFVWNKFYRRSFLKKVNAKFPIQRIQEDELFNLQLYPHAHCVLLSDRVLYHYNIPVSGNTQSRYFSGLFDMFVNVRNAYEHMIQEWELQSQQLKDYLDEKFYRELNVSICDNLLSKSQLQLSDKKKYFYLVINNNYSKRAIETKWNHCKRIEDILLLSGYRNRSFLQVLLTAKLFQFARRIKHCISKQ